MTESNSEWPTIDWTAPLLKEFKKAYALALEAKREEFTFEGHRLYVPYAGYLIEYLETRFK